MGLRPASSPRCHPQSCHPLPWPGSVDTHRICRWDGFHQAEEGLSPSPLIEDPQGLSDNLLIAQTALGHTGRCCQAYHQHECHPGPCHCPFSDPLPRAVPFKCYSGCLAQGLLATCMAGAFLKVASPFLARHLVLTNIPKYHWLRGKEVWATGQGLGVRQEACVMLGKFFRSGPQHPTCAMRRPPPALTGQDSVLSLPGSSGLSPKQLPTM